MREKFYRFMQGRYGVDQLYRFIFFSGTGIDDYQHLFEKSDAESGRLCTSDPGYFSDAVKNHSARYAENQKYLQLTAKFRYWLDQQKSSGRRESIIIFTLVQNVNRRSGFQKEKERSWCAARNVILSFRREAKRLCSDILLYTNRN